VTAAAARAERDRRSGVCFVWPVQVVLIDKQIAVEHTDLTRWTQIGPGLVHGERSWSLVALDVLTRCLTRTWTPSPLTMFVD
jgi:hypothetical protein